MTLSFFMLLLFYAILISSSTFFVLVWTMCCQKQKYIKELMGTFNVKVDQAEQEIEEQIDNRLNAIIAGFKAQIPMISMFLSKTKESELKETAKIELMKLFPALKENFLQKISGSKESQLSFEEQLNFQASQLLQRLWKQVKCPLFLTAIAVGSVLGALEVAVVYYVF